MRGCVPALLAIVVGCPFGGEVEPGDTSPEVDESEQGVGSACTCEGDGCDQMGVPIPNGGTIKGCDLVRSGWTGAERVCLRSYVGAAAKNTYFANGYCSLMGQDCEGSGTVCDTATMGSYAQMSACPEGTVMIDGGHEVLIDLGILGELRASLQTKTCAAACDVNADCRAGEHDPVLEETSEYGCLEQGGVRFCYDPRSLPDAFTATLY